MANPNDQFPQPNDDFPANNPYASPLAVPVGSRDQREGYVTRTDEVLNPWISMWTQPRATVRQQLDTDPWRHVLLVAALAGVSGQSANSLAAFPPSIELRAAALLGLMVGGAIMTLIWIFILGWVVGMTGRMIGGVANALECRTALAWSSIPTIWLMPFYLCLGVYWVITGPDAIEMQAPFGQLGGPPQPTVVTPAWGTALMVAAGFVGLWQIVITCKAVGEAHQFSAWRGLGALLLSGLAMMGLLIALAMVIGVLVAIISMSLM
ncbi:Yip1 family protein [Aeoliella sp.]|uniref:Yip1 family protein n=1 Tax=Aeoliella sp. TaxID=2795800 RepID=UPI003CCBC3E6